MNDLSGFYRTVVKGEEFEMFGLRFKPWHLNDWTVFTCDGDRIQGALTANAVVKMLEERRKAA